jgi:hypothetical protein
VEHSITLILACDVFSIFFIYTRGLKFRQFAFDEEKSAKQGILYQDLPTELT